MNGDIHIGSFVLAAKEKANLSLRQIARKAKLEQSLIAAIARGDSALTSKTAVKLEKVLGKNIFDAEQVMVEKIRREVRRLLEET